MIVQSRSDLFKSLSPASLSATMPFITILASFMIPLALKVGLAAKVDSITSRLTRVARIASSNARVESSISACLPSRPLPSVLITASWSRSASCRSSALRASPTATATSPRSIFIGSRTNAVTSWPAMSACRTTSRPVFPDAPSTRTFMPDSLPCVEGWSSVLDRAGVTEVHELPDRVIGRELIDELVAPPVLDPDLAREAQVGAVKAQQRSGGPPDRAQALDHAVARQVVMACKRDDEPIVAGPVRVPRDVGHRLPGQGVDIGAECLERHARGIIGDDRTVAREHEDRDRRVAVAPMGGDVRRNDRIWPSLAARPIPVMHDVGQPDIAPVVVVVAGARGLELLITDPVAHGDLALWD